MSDLLDAIGSLQAASGLSGAETSPVGTSLQDIAGPLFLGFAFQFFGMGVVLILSANYVCAFCTRSKESQADRGESTQMCCVVVATLALVFNLAQTAVDMHRGWQMFATNFMNLLALLTPNVGYFLSPFLGIIPAALTQAFLLRRCLLFISSLSTFWPRLAHPVTRWVFGLTIGGMILVSSSAGTIASIKIWKSPNLWSLDKNDRVSNQFQVAQLAWLAISSAVDVTLSAVLCLELWWARKHLANEGGAMRQVVTKLMFVTFHGGLAVTTIQLSALFLYQFATASSWCYFPMLSLPKIYNITLILSLSLPQGQAIGPSPSHVFSLPTIISHHASLALPPSPPTSQRDVLPENAHVAAGNNGTAKKRRRVTVQVVRTVQKSWRASQEWVHWSLVGHPSDRRIARSSWDPRGKEKRAGGDGESKAERDEAKRWDRHEGPDAAGPNPSEVEHRRPSEPNSLAPLLNPSSTRRPSTVALMTDMPTDTSAPENIAEVSPPQTIRPSVLLSPRKSALLEWDVPGLAAPLPTIAIDRANPCPLSDDELPFLPTTSPDIQTSSTVEGDAPPVGLSFARELFDRPDPFASFRSASSRTLTPVEGARRPSLSPLGDLRPPLTDPGPQGLEREHHHEAEKAGEDGEDEEGRRRSKRATTRMLSFEDMLAGGPDDAGGRKWGC